MVDGFVSDEDFWVRFGGCGMMKKMMVWSMMVMVEDDDDYQIQDILRCLSCICDKIHILVMGEFSLFIAKFEEKPGFELYLSSFWL
ncbi:hypothetical protein Q3G72_032792 [Acer saccharum]|nr:hypothetical protein Q3G72_032792 [Acer saccharum]